MIKWILIVVSVISAGVMCYVYVSLEAMQHNPVTIPKPLPPTRVYHAFSAGVHRYSGEIRLPHSCYTITAETKKTEEDPPRIRIDIKTTNNILDQKVCLQIETGYQFEVIADANEDTPFYLTVDRRERPIRVVEVDWESPKATLVN